MAAKTLAEAFLREHPELRSFLLVDARSTGTTLGSGSYGSVEEVAVPGAVCAAKKIHSLFQDATKVAPEWIEKTSAEFVRECLLMSTLRHPHIVQFLGVCFLPGSPIPALVMEKLLTSLHDVLDPEPPPPTKAYIPLSLKRSVLLDVANGLAFLHSHRPPIIHRDLSAKNILLNAGMTAKIADLGMARIVPALKAATMTKAPGASIYMPPEAMEDESKYDVTIDIFSLGVVAIFLLSQTFPKPLAAAYMNEKGVMVGRTELERRDNYTQQILSQLREAHPLVKMIQRCLKNRIHERPTIQNVVSLLTQARGEIDDKEYDVNKLELVRQLLLLKLRDEQIEPQQQLITLQKKSNRALKEQIGVQRARTKSLETQIDSLQAEVAAFKRDHKVCITFMYD